MWWRYSGTTACTAAGTCRTPGARGAQVGDCPVRREALSSCWWDQARQAAGLWLAGALLAVMPPRMSSHLCGHAHMHSTAHMHAWPRRRPAVVKRNKPASESLPGTEVDMPVANEHLSHSAGYASPQRCDADACHARWCAGAQCLTNSLKSPSGGNQQCSGHGLSAARHLLAPAPPPAAACSPAGPPRLACESVLLHHQALLVPERMVRLTVKLGMWGYVKGMAACLPAFCEGRRARAGPHEPDAGAYGCELYAAAPGAATDHGRAAAGASGAGRMVQLAAAPAGEVVEADVVEDGPQLLGQQAAGGMTGAEAAAGSGDGASGSNSSTSSGGGRRQGRGSVSYVVQLRHGHCEVQPQGSSSQQQGRGQARLPPPVQTATGEGAADRRYQRHQQQMAPATPLQVSPFAAASHSRTSSTGSTAHDSAASAHLAAASAISRAGRRSRGGSRAWGHAGWSLAHLRRLAAAALRDEMVWMMVTAVAAGGASAWLAQRSGGRGGGSRRAAHHPRLLGSCSSDVDYGEESEEPED